MVLFALEQPFLKPLPPQAPGLGAPAGEPCALVSTMIYPISNDGVPLKLLSRFRGPLQRADNGVAYSASA